MFSQYQNIGFASPLSRNDSTNGNRGGLHMLVLCFVNPSFSFFNLIISACYSFSDRFLCILFCFELLYVFQVVQFLNDRYKIYAPL